MSAYVVTVFGSTQRQHIMDVLSQMPPGARVTIRPPRRTLDQNAKLHAMIQDVARAKPEGREWDIDTWKAAFLAFMGREVEMLPGLEGTRAFPYGLKTSRLSKAECADLIECIYGYGARHGVRWTVECT